MAVQPVEKVCAAPPGGLAEGGGATLCHFKLFQLLVNNLLRGDRNFNRPVKGN